MTYTITLTVDATTADHDVATLAMWIGRALTEENPLGVVVRRVDVESEDG